MTTFSRDTADNIRHRLSEVTGQEIRKDTVNTIHGVCYGLLGGKGYGELIESKDIEDFNKATGYKIAFSNGEFTDNPGSSLIECISWLANTGTPLSKIVEYPGWRDVKMSPQRAIEAIKTYKDWKQENSKLDFTDMLQQVKNDSLVPDVDVLMVDEFQDLTTLQHDIFKMWAGEIKHVIIAGDPMQAIYDFWGADPKYFNSFDGEKITLPKSHRLSSAIWQYAKAITKTCGISSPVIETGTHPGIIRRVIHREYMNMRDVWEGGPGKPVFHLVRSNYQAPAITHLLAESGILWTGINGWSLHDIEATNAIISARAGNALKPSEILTLSEHYPNELFNGGKTRTATQDKIKSLNVPQFPGGEGMVSDKLYDILLSKNPVSYMSRAGELKTAKINNALARFNRRISPEDINTSILTIHASKGLEASRVFLHTGITTNLQKAARRGNSEARVFYVGVTRAIDELYLVKDTGYNFSLPAVVA
jgi:superfamily I DNA/RNA helicase